MPLILSGAIFLFKLNERGIIVRKLSFIQLQKNNEEHYGLFENLMIFYNKELREHRLEYPITDENVLLVTRGILNMQGPNDRHLELCYEGDNLIGFLYGKVDHEGHKGFIKPGYGYIMEFYVKPEFRRKGYGTAMFEHLEDLFANHGTRSMYLTADPVTGEPFWESMGFETRDETSPENGQPILEKDVRNPREIITVQISEYLNDELAQKIAMFRFPGLSDSLFRIVDFAICGKMFSDYFTIIAMNQLSEVVGFAAFIQNEIDVSKWFYADLGVHTKYRRVGIGRRMVEAGIEYLTLKNATILITTVSPNNTPSLNFQKSLGFQEISSEPFNDLFVDRDIMFRKELSSVYSAIQVTEDKVRYVSQIMFDDNNLKALHSKRITFDEWKSIFSDAQTDEDEKNFLICKGVVPYAWLKINGLQNNDMAWISMLVVFDRFKGHGAGTYAVKFAEEYIRTKGKSKVCIHTTEDNILAQSLYKKCGYTITDYKVGINEDGIKRMVYTFKKCSL